jgi:hypothetical protein
MNSNEDVPYVATLFMKAESGSELVFKHSPAFKATDDDEAIVLANAWATDHKPQLYEAVKLELRHGDALIKQWPIKDANFSQ